MEPITYGCLNIMFPISRDPPEGGTSRRKGYIVVQFFMFPISRDPPEGGTWVTISRLLTGLCFQFLGIPPKGELSVGPFDAHGILPCFQFLGIPPKGEPPCSVRLVQQVGVSNF